MQPAESCEARLIPHFKRIRSSYILICLSYYALIIGGFLVSCFLIYREKGHWRFRRTRQAAQG